MTHRLEDHRARVHPARDGLCVCVVRGVVSNRAVLVVTRSVSECREHGVVASKASSTPPFACSGSVALGSERDGVVRGIVLASHAKRDGGLVRRRYRQLGLLVVFGVRDEQSSFALRERGEATAV